MNEDRNIKTMYCCEGKKIQVQLVEMDAKIAAFKSRNLNSLQGAVQSNLQKPDHNEQTINQLNDRLHALQEKERHLQSQLTGTLPDSADRDRERLNELLRTYVKLRFSYSDVHPDMIKVRREIADLEQQLGSARQQTATGEKSDNPANEALAAQLTATQSDIRATQKQISLLRSKRDSDRNRTETGLWTEEQYKPLLIKRTNLQAKLDDLMKKHRDAGVDRFTLIKPAPFARQAWPTEHPRHAAYRLDAGRGSRRRDGFHKRMDRQIGAFSGGACGGHSSACPGGHSRNCDKGKSEEVMKKRMVPLMIVGAGIVCGLLIFIS